MSAQGTMHFGPFPITEAEAFPPPESGQCFVYLTLNAEIALSYDSHPALQALVASPRARISIDGQWLWWALRRKYPDRPLTKLAGSDLIDVLAAHCRQADQRLLLLGSTPEANAAAIQRLRGRWPGLQVAGWSPPLYRPGSAQEGEVLEGSLQAIQAWRPRHVVLGLGAEREQRLARRLLPLLDGEVAGLYCFGGAIDLASGRVRRAPVLWQRSGLEGLYRVIQQPGRLLRLLKVLRILPRLWFGRY